MQAKSRLQILPRVFAVFGGLLFVASLLYFTWQYAAGFDQLPPAESTSPAIAWDVGLFSAFALHHSIFARLGVKGWIRRVAPPTLERSIYVWISSLLFIGICGWWRGVPFEVWHVTGIPAALMASVQIAGGILAVGSASALDVFDLAGVRQTFMSADHPKPTHVIERGPYGIVRHPIYLGWFAGVWLAPHMNGARLVFAAISCLYLIVAVPFEEQDLKRSFGAPYEDYMRRVRWKIIPGVF